MFLNLMPFSLIQKRQGKEVLLVFQFEYVIVIVYEIVIVSDLALMMKKLLTIYDNLFEVSFPYSMGWHGRWH